MKTEKTPDYSQAPVEYFLLPLSAEESARVPFPYDLPMHEREAYMANPPADAVASAERVAIPKPPKADDEPAQSVDAPTPDED
jgi:hypothetical protein